MKPVAMIRQAVEAIRVVGEGLVDIKLKVSSRRFYFPQRDARGGEEALIDHVAVGLVVLAGEAQQGELRQPAGSV